MPVGPSPALSAVLLVVGATALGVVIARVRLATGSIWPAIAFHLAWNTIIQEVFKPATTGPGAMLWLGEYGILTVLVLVVAAVICSRGRWTMLRQPAKP
jgi:membrane protease YdiL (CAAX protease family)